MVSMNITPSQIRMSLALLGWTIRDASSASGISRNTIAGIANSDLEGVTCKHEPNTRTVRKIKEILSEKLNDNGWRLNQHSIEPIEN